MRFSFVTRSAYLKQIWLTRNEELQGAIDSIRHSNEMPHRQDFLWNKVRCRHKLWNEMRRRPWQWTFKQWNQLYADKLRALVEKHRCVLNCEVWFVWVCEGVDLHERAREQEKETTIPVYVCAGVNVIGKWESAKQSAKERERERLEELHASNLWYKRGPYKLYFCLPKKSFLLFTVVSVSHSECSLMVLIETLGSLQALRISLLCAWNAFESRSEPNPNIKGKRSFVPKIWKSVTFCDILWHFQMSQCHTF